MHYALAGEWEQAYRYALEAIVARRSSDVALIPQDFSFHYETEALLRGGDERQARAEVLTGERKEREEACLDESCVEERR